MENSGFIRNIRLHREKTPDFQIYPFCLPAVRDLNELPLHPEVTFFAGENGTGKSTLIEAIAVVCGFNPEGGSKNYRFSTFESHSELYRFLSVIRGARREKDGFFLRAESFYNLASNMEALDSIPAYSRPIKESYGGKSLHNQSHGESFFALIENRLGGNGLYIFDEPEAALSPMRQIALLAHIDRLVRAGSQMLIATHSPILLSYPRSVIYIFSENGITETAYEDTEHYRTTKDYLNNYKHIAKHLFAE